jgi:hypothetical protein
MIRGKLPWILPILCALVFSPPALGGSMPVKMKRQGNRVEISIGGQPFTTFYFGPEAPKPYLHPLRSAQGIVVTRGFPMRKDIPGESTDHPHHRAMYFAHGDINGIDFWSEAQFEEKTTEVAQGVQYTSEGLPHGRTVFKKLDEIQGGKDSGALRANFSLVGPDGKPIAEETQTYTFSGDAAARIIDCEFTIKALDSPVKMGDTKEGTFAIRVVKALEDPGGHMLNSEGGVGEEQIWGKRASWVDYSGSVEGKPLGIAIFDHPSNPKHPTYWHARKYGLFAVNPFGEHDFYNDKSRDGSITISPGDSLTFRYRVLIHDGDAAEAKVAEAYARYAAGN